MHFEVTYRWVRFPNDGLRLCEVVNGIMIDSRGVALIGDVDADILVLERRVTWATLQPIMDATMSACWPPESECTDPSSQEWLAWKTWHERGYIM